MPRNDLFLLLACAAILATMATNPPTIPGKHVTVATLWPRSYEPVSTVSEASTLQP